MIVRQQAERLVRSELAKRGWTEKDLRLRRKGDRIKLQIAQHLRAHCSATIPWIAERLQMGTAGHLAHLLYWAKRDRKPHEKRPSRWRRQSARSKRSR